VERGKHVVAQVHGIHESEDRCEWSCHFKLGIARLGRKCQEPNARETDKHGEGLGKQTQLFGNTKARTLSPDPAVLPGEVGESTGQLAVCGALNANCGLAKADQWD